MIKKFDIFENKKEKVLYSSIVLDAKSRTKLLKSFGNIIPETYKIFAHHMTITFGKGLDSIGLEGDVGKNVNLTVTHLGESDMAIAVKVKGYKTTNKIPHITLATNIEEGGKPVMSNQIDNWEKVKPLILTGIVTEMKQKK